MSDKIEPIDNDSFYSRNNTVITVITTALTIQAILGIIAIEYAFCRLKRMRKVDEKRDE